jgi:Cytochrome C oxidase, cbb3-type, subunit III
MLDGRSYDLKTLLITVSMVVVAGGVMARGRVGLLSRTALFFALAILTSASGCGEVDSYPAELRYPVRTDLLMVGLPKAIPAKFNNPGRLPLDTIAALPMRFDASKKARVIDYAKVDQLVKEGVLKLDENDKALLEESKNNIIDPRNLTAAERNKIDEVLTKLFRTPANPLVLEKTDKEPMGFAKEFIERLKLDPETLKEGSRLYRHHCLHCHGLEGNGRGPTGYWVSPHPRDYRQGIFKFTSSSQDLGERKPRRDDLMHILVHGIEGSSMPSFGNYDRTELDKIISYVMHLSIRGEIECYVIGQCLTGSTKLVAPPNAEEIEAVRKSMQAENKPADEIKKAIDEIVALKAPTPDEEKLAHSALEAQFGEAIDAFPPRWLAAQDAVINPDAYPYPDSEDALLASAARGAALFMQAGDASCVSCHKNFGRESPYSFDAWGTIVRPRDLVGGYYRGGRRPVDMYYRVSSGINGAGMASYDKLLRPTDEDKAKKIDKIWDLVNFMQVLHYPDMRTKLKDKHGVVIE